MKITITLIALMGFTLIKAQTIPTTTVTGNLSVNDSLHVVHNISNLGNISSSGDIKANGEIVSKDTMRAEKDVKVDGNATINGNLNVGGTTNVQNLRVGGNVSLGPYSLLNPSPCDLIAVLAVPDPTHPGSSTLAPLSPSMITNLDFAYDSNPCAAQVPSPPPIIPFVWQTYGNHVNSNQRWIGTYENFDFNIKTNNIFRMVMKNNGDIGIGAFGGNGYTTATTNYHVFIKNNGEVNFDSKVTLQVAGTNVNAFNVLNGAGTSIFDISTFGKTNIAGEVKIGGQFATSSPYMLTVNGRIGAREIKVSIQNPWPDYVFSKSYKLQSLESLEGYIFKNKHLPNIPAAEDLKKEECGLDLAQMQGMQMEKIEEIYLHLIELNKQMKELKKENELLKQQLHK